MRPYRVNSSDDLDVPPPPARRGRAVAIIAFAAGLHAAVLGAAFAARAPEPTSRIQTVHVLTGHVDPMTGSFEAHGMADARIAKR